MCRARCCPRCDRRARSTANRRGAPRGAMPIAGIAGDQQAALFGQACFEPGTAKNTYGTGCFMLLNTGEKPVPSKKGLLTTIAWQIGGKTTYALEGSVFVAGAAVQWLRDGLEGDQGVGRRRAADGKRAGHRRRLSRARVRGARRAVLGPARARRIVGLTREHDDRAHRSGGGGFDGLSDARRARGDAAGGRTRVDDAEGRWRSRRQRMLLQFQADLLGVPVRRPVVGETTALGAAYLAGLAAGYWEVWTTCAGTGPSIASSRRRDGRATATVVRRLEKSRRALARVGRLSGPR